MLSTGDLVPTKTIRHQFPKGWGQYDAEKGKHMLFLYLGQAPDNNSKNIKPETLLNQIGWYYKKPQ